VTASTVPAASRGETVRSFLLGPSGVPDVTPPRANELGRLTRGAGHGLRAEIATVLAGLLELDLVDLLVGGWRKYDALVQAARATAQDPSSSAVVDLATHRVDVSYTPRVNVTVDGVAVAHVDAAAIVVFDVTGVAATLRRGAVVALTGGSATVSAQLSVEGVVVAHRSAPFDLWLSIDLGDGVRLVPDAIDLSEPSDREPV
jgi:hypothetical protein